MRHVVGMQVAEAHQGLICVVPGNIHGQKTMRSVEQVRQGVVQVLKHQVQKWAPRRMRPEWLPSAHGWEWTEKPHLTSCLLLFPLLHLNRYEARFLAIPGWVHIPIRARTQLVCA